MNNSTNNSTDNSTTADSSPLSPSEPWSFYSFLSSLTLPVFYLISLFGFLYSAAKYYKRKNLIMQRTESGYFPFNRSKYEYEELSEQFYIDDPNGVKILTIALMKRAMESVRRVLRLQQEKAPLQQMVREGVIGEKLWEKLQIAEQEVEQELKDCMEESNLYKPGWDATFVQEASQLVQMQMQAEAQKAQQLSQDTDKKSEDADHEPKSATFITTDKEKGTMEAEPAELDDEARERLAQELIEEEEREAAKQQQKNKQKRNSSSGGGGHSKQNSGGKRNSTGGSKA